VASAPDIRSSTPVYSLFEFVCFANFFLHHSKIQPLPFLSVGLHLSYPHAWVAWCPPRSSPYFPIPPHVLAWSPFFLIFKVFVIGNQQGFVFLFLISCWVQPALRSPACFFFSLKRPRGCVIWSFLSSSQQLGPFWSFTVHRYAFSPLKFPAFPISTWAFHDLPVSVGFP